MTEQLAQKCSQKKSIPGSDTEDSHFNSLCPKERPPFYFLNNSVKN